MTSKITAIALSTAFVAALGATLTIASATDAHSDASNPAVKARMEAMKVIGAQTKVLGDMAKGATAFDAAAAQAAAATMAAEAAKIPALFEPQEDDPESEAKPIIWDQWDDFAAKAMDLENAATAAQASLTDAGAVGPALGQIGGTCKACHSTYRE